MIRSLFLGTPAEAIPTLDALVEVSSVVKVVTRPDRPKGRSRRPQASPVGRHASELGLGVVTPTDTSELVTVVTANAVDVAVVAAFGMLVPPDALAHPSAGMVNVHYSPLPRWRGAAPVERAILGGDTTTGVTLMAMDPGLDTGPVFGRWETSIGADETAGSLTERLATAGAELMSSLLADVVGSTIEPQPQDDSQATGAPRITVAEARIDWAATSDDVLRRVRAYNPRPGAFTQLGPERFKVLRATPTSQVIEPGVIAHSGDLPMVGTGDRAIGLAEVQAAGSRPMSGRDWWRGVRSAPGAFK